MRIGMDVMGATTLPTKTPRGLWPHCLTCPPRTDWCRRRQGDHRGHARERGVHDARIEVVHASGRPSGWRNRRLRRSATTTGYSSINVCARMASPRDPTPLDALISAGNTCACVAASQMFMKRLPNVHRPGIAVTVPTFSGPVVLIDVGANIEPKPHHLAQYGVMGDAYAREILGIKNPRVALMNVGGEEAEGHRRHEQSRHAASGRRH